MMFFRNALLLIVFYILANHVAAQKNNAGLPEIINYKRSDYNGATQNWAIDQDKNGNLYFANNAGLFMFNGTAWSKYELPNHSYVRCVKTGDSDKIYVGGYDEFGYFQPGINGKLIYHSLKFLINNSSENSIDFIWKIHDINNKIIFQSFSNLYIYNSKKIDIIKAPQRFQFSFNVNNKLYCQDVSAGILELTNNGLVSLPNTSVLNASEIWGIIPFKKNLLIATQKKGIFIYVTGSLKPWKSDADIFLKKNGCLGGIAGNGDFIAFNTVLDGVIICDTSGKILYHLNQKNGLQNNTVLCSFIDNKNDLWLGLDNGIDFINSSSPLTYFGSNFNLGTVYASALYNNNLYVATNQGLFYKLWNTSPSSNVFKLVEGTTGQAWNIQVIDSSLFCAHNSGLLLVSNPRSVKVLDSKGYWGVKKIPGHQGIVIGAHYNGFALFKKNEGLWGFKNSIEGTNKSASIFEVDNNCTWIIKDSLLYQMQFNQNFTGFQAINAYKKIANSANAINGLYLFNNKVIFQSGQKFYDFSWQTNSFTNDTAANKFFKNLPQIGFLQQDVYGNVWYESNEFLGMLKKNKSNLYYNIVSPFVNLKNDLVYDYLSVNVIDSENVFVGLTNGLAHCNLSLIHNTHPKPNAFINTFSFQEDTIYPGNIAGNYAGKIIIPYTSNNVKFTFSSPEYSNPKNLEFSYKLKGFNNKWSQWSTEHVKEYSNLHEGNYSLFVKSRTGLNDESRPYIISFTVSPPFYRRNIAYLLYIILFVTAIFIIGYRIKIKIRKNKYYETLEHRKIYLEREQKIRLEQNKLEEEIKELKFEKLRNSLISKDRELVNNSFQVVKKNNILNGILNKIKKIDESAIDESTKIQLHKLGKSITKELDANKSWYELEKHIQNVHFDFLKRLKEKYPEISPRELDLATYLLTNMSSKEIAVFMNISIEGVELARYRLRKKLCLSREQNLVSFLMNI